MTQAAPTINWLSLVLSALVGGLAGYISARIQEFEKNRRRLRALAGALKADSLRLRSELGTPGDEYVESQPLGSVQAPVGVHRWTEKLITDSAEISPAIVEQFMILERALENFNTFRDGLRLTRNAIANLQQGAESADHEGVAGVVSSVEARRQIGQQQAVESRQNRLVVATRKQTFATLDKIERLLAPYL